MTEHAPYRASLSDEQLDALLSTAGADLLDYVRATGNPARGLLALMDESTESAPTANPGSTGPDAAMIISARARTSAFLTVMHQVGLAIVLQHAREFDRNRGLARAHALAYALEYEHDVKPAHARDLVHALDHALTYGLDRDLTLARDLVRTRDLARGRVRALNRALNRALALDLDLDLDHAHELARDLDRTQGRGLANLVSSAKMLPGPTALRTLGLDPSLAPTLGPDPARPNIKAAYHTAGRLLSALMAVRVDASGANLSKLDLGLGGQAALVGVVWTVDTRWPPRLAEFVERSSREIADGVFQVVDGDAHDNADVLTDH